MERDAKYHHPFLGLSEIPELLPLLGSIRKAQLARFEVLNHHSRKLGSHHRSSLGNKYLHIRFKPFTNSSYNYKLITMNQKEFVGNFSFITLSNKFFFELITMLLNIDTTFVWSAAAVSHQPF